LSILCYNPQSKKEPEPLNKESYDRQIVYEKQRMQELEEYLEQNEASNRGLSLMEIHQKKKELEKKGKGKQSLEDFMKRPFDKDKDFSIGKIDSKRAIKTMRESNGLQNRFEAKEKYLGI